MSVRAQRASHWRKLVVMYTSAPVNHTIPSRLEVSLGRAQVQVTVSEALWHAAGSLHGSMYFKALDDAAFFAAQSTVFEAFVLTAEFETRLLAPVTGSVLRAVGTLDRREGRKVYATSELYDGEEHVGSGTGVFVVSEVPLDSIDAYVNG